MHCPPSSPLSAGGGGGGLATDQFLKKGGGLDRISIFSLSAKMFFFVTTENLTWEILTKDLVIFKRWNDIKDEKF